MALVLMLLACIVSSLNAQSSNQSLKLEDLLENIFPEAQYKGK